MTTEHIAILCTILGLLTGCAVGYYAGLNVGRAVGWERCKQHKHDAERSRALCELYMRRIQAGWTQYRPNARRDPATGRYRKAQP
jgi:hypothetical protein